MHNNGDDNDVSERCFSFDLSQTHTRLVGDHTQSQHGRQRSTQTLWNILSDKHVQNLPMRDETANSELQLKHSCEMLFENGCAR